MSGSLTHPPDQIIQYLMVDLSLGTLPASDGSWPIFCSQLPEDPDNAIYTIRTAGKIQGKRQPTGETIEHYGIQVMVRGTTYAVAFAKVQAIANSFDVDVLRDSVSIDSSVYVVQAITRASGPIALGDETPESKRQLFSLNVTVSLRQIS